MSNDFKINTILLPTATGDAANSDGVSVFKVGEEDKIRIVVEGAGGGNVIVVKAKINLETNYEDIKTITGSGSFTVNVSTYDSVKFNVTTYANSGEEKIVISSFNEASGSAVIGVPAGTTVEGDPIRFTSTGSSLTITKTAEDTINFEAVAGSVSAASTTYDNTASGLAATNVQDAIDELVSVESYSDTFIIADWVLNVDHYELVINEATHLQGVNPDASIYEQNGAEYDEVSTGLTITNAGVVTFKVSNVPDLRFDGRLIIK